MAAYNEPTPSLSGSDATPSDVSDEENASSESSGSYSDASGSSVVPSVEGDDEDDEEPARATGGGLLGYLGLAAGAGDEADPADVTDDDDDDADDADDDDAYQYDFEGELPLQDETYDFGDDAREEDELEEGLKDDRLEKRLEMAYAFSTKDAEAMGVRQFRQAVAMMGKVFTKEETDQFFDEAVIYERQGGPQGKPTALGNSAERDDRGLLRRNPVDPSLDRSAHGADALTQKAFVAFFERYMTRTVDPREAAEHFRALVEGAAEQALRNEAAGADGTPDAVANRELQMMKDTKHVPITKIFIYAKDLRKVMVGFSEKLTDEEADAFVRECKPKAEAGAGDGGLERVYFHQYLTMLKDDS